MSESRNTFEVMPISDAGAHHVLALLAYKDEDVFASGSAVLVAPHLAFTARHVIDDFTCRYEQLAGAEPPAKFSYEIVARGYHNGRWWMFDVRQVHGTPGTDIVALDLSLAAGQEADFQWPRITLDYFPPRRWRKVWSWGHITPLAQFTDFDRGALEWHACFCRSCGTVREIFPRRRDRCMVDFPAFQFDGRVDPSMSGGPVFNELGHLVGINSSSMAATSEHPDHVSTTALLWPVPALPFTNRGDTFDDCETISFVQDLHAFGYLEATNHVFIEVDRNAAPGDLVVSIRLPRDRC